MTAQEKIEKLLTYLNTNAKAFSEVLGYMRPQIIYDIQKGKTKRISEELANKIASVFPEVSKSWLLAGEGNMLKSHISQTSHGDNSPNIAGNGITQTVSSAVELDKALGEIAEMRKIIQEQTRNNQEQFDRFMSVIEHLVSK